MTDVPIPATRPKPRPTNSGDALQDAAQKPSESVTSPCKKCEELGDIIAYDIEGYYIGTKPPVGDDAYLTTKAVVDANRVGDKVRVYEIINNPETKALGKHSELLKLGGVAYGEASTKDVYEEMAGIASVVVRVKDARKTTISNLLSGNSTYAFAASDGNSRHGKFMKASVDERNADTGMRYGVKAAINAITGGQDYSNGAYFWDGADIGTNYKNHAKIKKGFKFTDDSHRIYNVGGSPIADNELETQTTYWYDKKGKPTKVRGTYTYTYETTAAWGGTIFSKKTSEYLKATGEKAHQ